MRRIVLGVLVGVAVSVSTMFVVLPQQKMSEAEAIQIMSEYGIVTIESGVVIYRHSPSFEGWDKELLQALATISNEYMVYSSHQ